ncbi:MAG: sugar phosphate isomerase/epimerase family protein [Lawsonibacter sp.]
MKFGLHFRSWDGLYSLEQLPRFLRQAKSIGAETFEVFPPPCVLECDRAKIRELRRPIDDVGLELLLTFRYPGDMDLASEDPWQRENGVAFMKRAIEGAAELGSREIGGIVYSVWPHRFDDDMIDKRTKYDRTQRSIESMRKIMPTAQECGVRLNAEVLNRFEHYMLNTMEEGVDYCRQVDSPNLGLLADVFHMNVEEEFLEDAIRTAGPYIGHFHVSEPNRAIPHRNSRLNWGSIGRALRETGYQGTVTLEPILLFLGKASYNSRLWRDLIGDGAQEERLRILKEGLDLIRGEFEG